LLQQLSPEQLKKAGADHGISPQEITDLVSTMAVKFKTSKSVKQPDPVDLEMCIDEEQLRKVAEELVAAGRGEVEGGANPGQGAEAERLCSQQHHGEAQGRVLQEVQKGR